MQDRPDRLMVSLPNRMVVIAQEVHAAPVVSAQVWIKTGSIYEQEHVGAGLSHFLEHLISGGTTSTRAEDESSAMLGAIGAQTNAATSLATVRYYINTTSGHTGQAVDLLSDWMQNSLITQAEYERERSVIQREFEMGRGEPGRIFWKLTQQARYTAHPARHPTIGYLDEFLSVTRDEIYDFYKRMYVPNNMVFVVVGDIDKQKVVDQVASLWQDTKPGDLPELSLPVEPKPDKPRRQTGTADIDKPSLRLAWPGTRLTAQGDYALDLLAAVLGQGESSRLVRTVRDQQRAVDTISAYNLSFAWGEGYFGIDAQVSVPPMGPDATDTPRQWLDRHIQRARDAILEQVSLIQKQGVTPQELARAKRKAMAAVVYNAQSAQAIASRLAGDLIGMGDPDYLQHYARAIQDVTAQEVQQAAVQFLTTNHQITLHLLPQDPTAEATPLTRPADPSIDGAIESEAVDLDNAAVVARFNSRTVPDAGASASSIEIEQVQSHTLPNGLRVLVGRSTLVPAIAMQMYHLGGLLADPVGREGVTNTAATMRIKGTATRTAQQIAQMTEDLGAALSTHGGYNTAYTKAVCLKDDWATVLGLLADVTLNPSFPDDEWQKLQPRLLAAIDRQTDTWTGELRQRFRSAYFGDHPWSQTPMGRRSTVEAITTDDLRAWHRNHLGADEAVLVVIGDVDPDQVVAKATDLFASMPARSPQPVAPPLVAQNSKHPHTEALRFKTSKPLAAVQIGFGPTVDRRSDDYAPLQVLSTVMSRFPSGWLEQELRGRGPGLVYAVGAGQFTGLVPGYFAVMFNTQPETVDEALRRAMGVVTRARDTRVDDADLDAAKAKVLTNEFLYKQTHDDRAAEAAINELYGLGPGESQRFLDQVQQTDAARLQAIARRYLVNPVTVILNHQEAGEGQPTQRDGSH